MTNSTLLAIRLQMGMCIFATRTHCSLFFVLVQSNNTTSSLVGALLFCARGPSAGPAASLSRTFSPEQQTTAATTWLRNYAIYMCYMLIEHYATRSF